WAAGVKAPDVLENLDGLETNRLNQLVVTSTLQATRDENIFVIGDCAACAWNGKPDQNVPPRAQAAHQQATHVFKQVKRRLAGQPLAPWHYRDFGSLVSLGEYSTVGSLMGGLIGRSLWIEGLFARLMYRSLYKMHEFALHGPTKVTLDTVARLITRRTEPHVKARRARPTPPAPSHLVYLKMVSKGRGGRGPLGCCVRGGGVVLCRGLH